MGINKCLETTTNFYFIKSSSKENIYYIESHFRMDLSYIRTNHGLIQASQVVIASIGGIFNLALGGTWGFWSFVFWSTAIFSAIILGLNVFKILPALEKSTPIISKVILGYSVVYGGLYLILSIWSFITFQLSAILIYILLILFGIDLFFKYREYKSGTDVTASNPAATAASGGEIPKY